MNTDENKYFVFYDSSRPSIPCRVHYTDWFTALGESASKKIYLLEDLEKLYPLLSKTQVSRIKQMKPGTSLKMHYLHSVGDLMLKRLNSEEGDLFFQEQTIETGISETWDEIKASCPEAFEKLKELEKQKRALDKQMKKLNFSK